MSFFYLNHGQASQYESFFDVSPGSGTTGAKRIQKVIKNKGGISQKQLDLTEN